jgi:molecular chaperone GrpE
MKHDKGHREQEPRQEADHQPGPQGQPEPAAPASNPEIEQLRQQLQTLQGERDELFARLQRLSADYSNYQKRVHKQIGDAVAYEKEKLVRTLLPLCDSLEVTIKNARQAGNSEAIMAGVQIIYDQMLDVLRSHEVEPIKTVDQRFDPSLHQALLQRSDPQREDNLVLEECQKGYTLAGRVLRPSKVIVNRAPARPNPAPSETPVQQAPEEKKPEVE